MSNKKSWLTNVRKKPEAEFAADTAAFELDSNIAGQAGVSRRSSASVVANSEAESDAESRQNAAARSSFCLDLPIYLIGFLFLFTAIAKLWMLVTDPFADVRVGLPKEILWLSVAFELWLAFVNFRRRDRNVLAFVDTIVFACFAIFAGVRLMMGYRSCGCSGGLKIPGWVFLLIDCAIVGWLAGTSWSCVTQGRIGLQNLWRNWSSEKRGRLAGIGLFGVGLIALQLPITAPLRATVLGEPSIQAIVKVDSELALGQPSTGLVEIVNNSLHPTKIIGMSRSCRCFDLTGDPIAKTVPASGRITFPLEIKPKTTGPLHQRVVLFVDHPKQFQVNVDLFGSVKE